MHMTVHDLLQVDGYSLIADGAERVLAQLRTTGNVEIVVAAEEPSTEGIQGFLLTERGPTVFSVTGLGATDKVFARVLGLEGDSDTLVVMENGGALA